MRQRVFADGCPARSRLRRLSLRHSALRYATHDWGVLPGACLIGARFTCGLGCRTVAVHPALEPWGDHVTTDPDEVSEVYFNSDRVLHMRAGRIAGEYVPGVTSERALAEALYG